MTLWWLRLIDHRLLRDLAQLEADKVLLQDRLEQGDQERSRLWEQNQALIENLETYHRMDKNLEWQSKGAPCPFPESPHLPQNLVHVPDNSPQTAPRSQGRQMVAAANHKFFVETAKRFNIDLEPYND